MGTIITHKLYGVAAGGFKEFNQTTILANYGFTSQPSIDIEEITFVNSQSFSDSTLIRDNFYSNPVEAGTYSINIDDGVNTFTFDFLLDYSEISFPNDSETKIKIIKDKSLDSILELNGESITMELLNYKGLLNSNDYINIPYIVVNRKTLLEKAQILLQAYTIFKAAYDEVYKIINIASDLASVGVFFALANLALFILNVVLLIGQIINLTENLISSFSPTVRYHSGILLKTFLTKAFAYLGYSVDFGNQWEGLNGIGLCPSKDDEEGFPTPITTLFQKGTLKPRDFGYTLKESLELCGMLCKAELAVIGDTVHIRPEKDPFWQTPSSYQLPNVLVEDSPFVQNGNRTVNYDELNASTLLEYSIDDSNYWTLHRVASIDNSDALTSVVRRPLSVTNERSVLVKGIDNITIPYSLCVRNTSGNILGSLFDNVIDKINEFKDAISDSFLQYDLFNNASLPFLGNVESYINTNRSAMKVENHFFSSPIIVYMEDGKIPINFGDFIGTQSIYEKYYKWGSLVAGVRDPSNPSNTNGKEVFKGVRTRFNASDFQTLTNNSYFSSSFGNGRFTKIAWSPVKDEAIIDFWVQKNWLNNMEEVVI